MKRVVGIDRVAAEEIEHAARWWRENRSAAPDLFDQELFEALELVAQTPGVGQPVKTSVRGVREVRVLVLRRTQHRLFFRVTPRRVRVLMLRHAARKPTW